MPASFTRRKTTAETGCLPGHRRDLIPFARVSLRPARLHPCRSSLPRSSGPPSTAVGATFNEVYNGDYSYVVWNDQFYAHPKLDCASTNGNCSSPWGHSKGMLAWDASGDGLVLQVSTPSWPGGEREPS